MKPTPSRQSKARDKRRSIKPEADEMHQATSEDFDREGMGVAPKE